MILTPDAVFPGSFLINAAPVCVWRKVQFEGFHKHTFAQGVATSPGHDGESDGRRQGDEDEP